MWIRVHIFTHCIWLVSLLNPLYFTDSPSIFFILYLQFVLWRNQISCPVEFPTSRILLISHTHTLTLLVQHRHSTQDPASPSFRTDIDCSWGPLCDNEWQGGEALIPSFLCLLGFPYKKMCPFLDCTIIPKQSSCRCLLFFLFSSFQNSELVFKYPPRMTNEIFKSWSHFDRMGSKLSFMSLFFLTTKLLHFWLVRTSSERLLNPSDMTLGSTRCCRLIFSISHSRSGVGWCPRSLARLRVGNGI